MLAKLQLQIAKEIGREREKKNSGRNFPIAFHDFGSTNSSMYLCACVQIFCG